MDVQTVPRLNSRRKADNADDDAADQPIAAALDHHTSNGFIAGWLLPRIGVVIGGGVIGSIINAFIGAVILLVTLRLIKL